MRNRLTLIPVLLTLVAVFQGCSNEDVTLSADNGPVPVFPDARVEGENALPADGSGFADGEDRFRLSAFLSDDKEPEDWTVKSNTSAFENEPVDVTNGIPVTRTPRYYPSSGSSKKLWFYAYAPEPGSYTSGNGTTPPVITYDLTRKRQFNGQTWSGQEDIMVADVTNNGICSGDKDGEGNQKHPTFHFRHLLKRLTFKLVQGEGFATGLHASVIRIADCHTRAELDVATGKLTFDKTVTGNIEVTGTWAIMSDGVELPNVQLLCEPGEEITVEVVSAGITFSAKVTLESDDPDTEAGGAGVSHLVTLTFKGTKVEASATVAQWIDAGEESGEIK